MVSKTIRKIRCDDVLDKFLEGSKCSVFLTLTTKEVCDYVEIRSRWRCFRHEISRALPDLKYIMNYEMHPGGHGWHIHAVFNKFLPFPILRKFATLARFGRLDVQKVNSKGVSDYLSKHCLKAFRIGDRSTGLARRVRLVNMSRGLPRLSDYFITSPRLERVRQIFNFVRLHSDRKPSFKLLWQFSEVASSFDVPLDKCPHLFRLWLSRFDSLFDYPLFVSVLK